MHALMNIPPEWNAIIGLVGGIVTIIVGIIAIKGAMNKASKENQERSDAHTKEIAETLFEKSNQDNVDLQANLSVLNKSITHLGEIIDSFKLSENRHFEEHEKHLIKTDLALQQNDDTLDDHENRIKDNEDDINYLKDKIATHLSKGSDNQ